MLQVSYIREHQTEVIERLSKRTKEAATLIEAVLKIDETRRGLQAKVDVISSELNVISKQIGELFKTDQSNTFRRIKHSRRLPTSTLI